MVEQPTQLWQWDAHALATALRERRISAVEVMDAHLERIAERNPALNAIVTMLSHEEARAAAADADRVLAKGEQVGPLHGMPIAIKDLAEVADMRTTFGSALFADHVATADHPVVARMRRAGAIVIGKTNSPEFGAGTLTFNDVFGPTANPYDLSRNAGGSSGGAAAAVAAGLLPFADGSDSGGSIRVPASFCNIVGLRPTPGLVPIPRDGWSPHGVMGPLARSVRDAGLLLAGMAGPDRRSPLARGVDPEAFTGIVPRGLRGVKVAVSHTVGGLPIEPAVTAVLDAAREALVDAGCVVEDVEPAMDGADAAWEAIELLWFAAFLGASIDADRSLVRDDVVTNVDVGRALTAEELGTAIRTRTEIFQHTSELLDDHEVLVLPAAPVPPPPLADEWVAEIEGVSMERYFDWQRCSTRVTITGHPTVVVPGGFTPEGLPIGLQLVGRYGEDAELLRIATGFEAATGHGRHRPAD